MKIVDLNYYCHMDMDDPAKVIALHAPSSGYIGPLRQYADIMMVKHMACEALVREGGINYHFFTGRNRFRHIPFRTHRFLQQIKPGVVLVQGFVFPVQVMLLRWSLGKKTRILVQHHGEKPFTGMKGWFQRLANRSIDGYLFTAKGNAAPWQSAGVIRDEKKIFELLSASTTFGNRYRKEGTAHITLQGDPVFLWVARLYANKDPLCVLKAFLRFLETAPQATLYLVYQSADLLPELYALMDQHPERKYAVNFIGQKKKEDMEHWFNAADFYISGSHSEGSGYALAEAMASGCIPVVTDIPSFKKITGDGSLGLYFEPGNIDSCYEALLKTLTINKSRQSDAVAQYAREHLGYEAIAARLFDIASTLIIRKAP